MVIFPHGETNVTLACQNNCVSCNHFIPLQDPWFIQPEDLKWDLDMAANLMHYDVYNLVGGEPTLHPQIVELLQIVKGSGIADRAEITSNGQSCRKWSDDFYRAVDDLIVTPYKLDGFEKSLITEKCAQFGVRLEWHPVIFTWAAFKEAHDEKEARRLYRGCWYNINRHVIDGGYFYRCCTAPFIPSLLLGMAKEADGIALEGLTEERLREYCKQEETPAACSVCASNAGGRIEWREERDRAAWRDKSLA